MLLIVLVVKWLQTSFCLWPVVCKRSLGWGCHDMRNARLSKETKERTAIDVHLLGYFFVNLSYFLIVINCLVRLFLFLFSFNGYRLSSQKHFLLLFPMVFQLKPFQLVSKEVFHCLKDWRLQILTLFSLFVLKFFHFL